MEPPRFFDALCFLVINSFKMGLVVSRNKDFINSENSLAFNILSSISKAPIGFEDATLSDPFNLEFSPSIFLETSSNFSSLVCN